MLVKFSCAAYRVLLALYPPDVRQRFGIEMADTFAQQMAGAWEEGGVGGFFAIWSLSLSELLCIAVPRQLVRPMLVVPFVSLLSTTAIFLALIWALQHPIVLSAWYHDVIGGGCH